MLKDVSIIPFKKWGMLLSNKSEGPNSPVAGLGVFKDKQILLDYKSRSLIMSEDVDYSALLSTHFSEFPFQMTPAGLAFDVEHLGRRYRLILDTGATVSMIWQERLNVYEPASCLLVDREMDNKGCKAVALMMVSKEGHREKFSAVVVMGNFKHMKGIDGLLGNNFIKNRKIFIDFKHKEIFISNYEDKVS